MPNPLPPPPIVCALSEHRDGAQMRIGGEIRAIAAQAGTYRLLVVKHGPGGSAQVSQQSDFRLAADAALLVPGVSLSLEPDARYRARLSIRIGGTDYTCERNGPDQATPL